MQLRLSQIEPEESLWDMSKRVLAGLRRPDRGGLLITGGTGKHEHWHEDQNGTGPIAEACATVYELWWLSEMMQLEENLSYGDQMERVLYNALFASQHPDGRQMFYFTPFNGPREPFVRDAFCCPNNFRRGMASLPELIYCQSDRGLAINLYTASQATVRLGNRAKFQVSQDTDYPASGNVRVIFEPDEPVTFSLYLRIPKWCREYDVSVNGVQVTHQANCKGGIELHRTWDNGDRIDLDMKMEWRWIKGRESQSSRFALLRGPIVYCGSRRQSSDLNEMELRDITIDPASLEFDGKGTCRTKGWRPESELASGPDLDLVLTEFSDPKGEEIYFRLPPGAEGLDDELIGPGEEIF